MAPKRKSDNEGDDYRNLEIPVQQSKRRHGDSEQMAIRAIGNWRVVLPINDIVSGIRDLVERLAREELQRLLLSSPTVHVGTSGAKPLQLRFANKVAATIFTKSKIKSEEDKFIQIELVDARSQSVIKEGPRSSLMIKMCVLKGEFGSKGEEDWTADQFHAHIISQRKGKEPLLKGDVFIRLQNGVGVIPNLVLTDNSHCTRSREFRLGAKAAEDIREGISNPFRVKENRGEQNKKHGRPSLDDNIFRLNKIAKNGDIYERLSSDGIKTVKDLLRLYITNPTLLHEKFGNIPKKKFEAITEHANTCVIDESELYFYHAAEEAVGLLFNSVYMLVGVTFDGKKYFSPDILTPNDKHLVERVKLHAYKNVNNLKPFDGTTFSLLGSMACREAGQCSGPDQGLQLNFETANHDQLEALPDFEQPSTSNMYNQFNGGSPAGLEDGSAGGELFTGMYNEVNDWPHIGSEFPVVPDSYPTWGPTGDGIYFSPCDVAEFSIHSPCHNSSIELSSSGKTRAVWYKIRTALIWVISIRRKAAAKRIA